MSDSVIYAKYVTTISAYHVIEEAATEYTKLLGQEILESTSKNTKEKPKFIKSNRFF